MLGDNNIVLFTWTIINSIGNLQYKWYLLTSLVYTILFRSMDSIEF